MGVVDFEAVRPYSAPVPLTAEHRIEGFDCGKRKLTECLEARALDNKGRAFRTYMIWNQCPLSTQSCH